MDVAEYESLVASLGDNERAMLAEIKRVGKATAPELRHVTKSPTTGAPLAYGLTREVNRLLEAGLVRQLGRKSPRRFEVVPLAAVEEAANVYGLRKKRSKKRKSPKQRLVELRTLEQGDYSEFYRVHRRVIELSEYVSRNITRMAFWEAAPKDDLSQVVQELADLREAVDDALACLKQRAEGDDVLTKIAKLQATHGRTPAEKETALALARKLRSQYDQRVGL